jgi:hypothetical protein
LPLMEPEKTEDLMIFPSREKYSDSRRLPFVLLHDRLRRLTASGESLLVIMGYSFGDEHINDIIFGNLRANNRLAATVFLYNSIFASEVQSKLVIPSRGIRNLTIYGPDGASVGSVVRKWAAPSKPPAGTDRWPFWDDAKSEFSLGNFLNLPAFLQEFIGARSLDAIRPASAPAP